MSQYLCTRNQERETVMTLLTVKCTNKKNMKSVKSKENLLKKRNNGQQNKLLRIA